MSIYPAGVTAVTTVVCGRIVERFDCVANRSETFRHDGINDGECRRGRPKQAKATEKLRSAAGFVLVSSTEPSAELIASAEDMDN
jgi:hypothetical protein